MHLNSVIVCTRNRGNSVVKTVETILANRDALYELILIDQSTNDETKTAVEQFCSDKRFRYIHSSTIGTGRSRNLGLQEANGHIVLYTDDDCRVPDDWVKTITAVFESQASVGMVFCNVTADSHDAQAGFIPTYVIEQDFIARSIKDKLHARGIGAGMAVRREVALAVGGFDELLGPGAKFPANEEGDLAVRMLFNGWHIYETSAVAVIHDGFRTWEQGKELAKRNWIGVGAAYSKPIKLRKWSFVQVVLYEGIVSSLFRAISPILRLKRPKGFRSFIFFWYGFFLGLRTPVESNNILFLKQ